ncbi:MAG: NAD(P)-dependent oxidoreductase [Spirochaetales bacterium]|jgi:3-hydroxyisobutyrate dehydrogenase-like beta-hydroxyacid dehydrogenase|nr:NAD(P)-dependent oxidoreductase [Spirochaetales bacterium]
MKTIGFIGLGNMGLPMALNLRKAGFPLLVRSSKPESAKQIEAAGGKSVSSFAELAKQADIIITMVPADREILEIYTGDGGLIDNMKDGSACIDMTTAKGSTKQAVADHIKRKGRKIHVVDAPVSGGIAGAKAGTLTIMVGCEKSAFDEYLPVFQAMGKKIVHTGNIGSASNIKMINQILNAGNSAILCEALCVAKKLGINPDIMYDIIGSSSGASSVFKNYVPRIMKDDYVPPVFRLDLMKKDVSLFIESARQHNAFTPMSEFVYQVFKAASNQGHGEKDTTYIFKWFEQSQRQ